MSKDNDIWNLWSLSCKKVWKQVWTPVAIEFMLQCIEVEYDQWTPPQVYKENIYSLAAALFSRVDLQSTFLQLAS